MRSKNYPLVYVLVSMVMAKLSPARYRERRASAAESRRGSVSPRRAPPEVVRAGARTRAGANDQGILNLDAALGLVGLLIGATILFVLMGALTSTFFGGVSDTVGNLTDANVTTGSTTADALKDPFGLLIAVGGLIAFVGLAIGVTRFNS